MTFLLLGLLFATSPPPVPKAENKVEIVFDKVGPDPKVPGRSKKQLKAVVLIHGLSLHPFSKEKAIHGHTRIWQLPQSALVRKLSEQADVYSLAYGQNVALDRIADDLTLLGYLNQLHNKGYREIILIGHSAGGLIARQLVEDNPGLGITRVIQVCSPNAGSGWAALKTASSAQMAFLVSLTRAVRLETLKKRDLKIPANVEFACVVASCRMAGDGVVLSKSQWSPDLQAQGIPAYWLRTTHWDVMSHPKTADLLARLVKEPQPRWDAKKVQQMRKSILP